MDECRSGPTYDHSHGRSLGLGKPGTRSIVRPDLPPTGTFRYTCANPPADARDREGHHLRRRVRYRCPHVSKHQDAPQAGRDRHRRGDPRRRAAVRAEGEGTRAPSRKNEEAFNAAVDEVASASQRLLDRVSAG